MDNVTNSSDGETTENAQQIVWWIYIVTFVIIYIVCAGLSCASYGIYYLAKKCNKKEPKEEQGISKKMRAIHEFVRQLISGDTIASKIFISLTFVCNLIYMILSVHRAYVPFQIEYNFILSQDPARIVELLVVIELIAYAIVRFLATNNVVWYWLDLYTVIDVLTLPHIFVSLALGVDWMGLRSARFFWLTQLVTVFRFIPWIHSQDIIDIFSLGVYFFILIFFGTGIIHLLEFSGDPWRENSVNSQFFSYAYFIIVTITTVGYGDISPETAIGQTFMVVYIVIGLAFFAALLPVISEVISNFNAKRQYAKFDRSRVPRHVIVCGHITAFTAQEFLKDFLHPDRGDTSTHVLFLHPTRPERELKNVLRSYYTRVQYIAGSVLNSKDLQKSKLFSSSAVFILADKYTNNPLEEDNGNLLRLVSIKNATIEIPVIIQLLLGTSKKQVKNIEGWNHGSDIAVCLNELKLGLLAQSCVCPGFSTLIANLFYTSDFPALESFEGANAWKEGYIEGASNEIYATHFSSSFEGKNFQEAAHICYNKLGLILLAFESPDGKFRKLQVNPSSESNPNVVVKSGPYGTRGYFIGQDIEHVSIASNYCETCDNDIHISSHELEKEMQKFARRITKRRCNCLEDIQVESNGGIDGADAVALKPTNRSPPRPKRVSRMEVAFSYDEDDLEDLNEKYNLFTCEPMKLEDAILDSDYDVISKDPKSIPDLTDHIVLCVFADDKSPLLGLHNFLFPLRNKNIPKESMKPVVILSNGTFLKREWPFIRKIPEVYIVDGSPLRVQNLAAAAIESCSVCIITTMLSADSNEPAINDKEVVLCSLSIQKYLKRNATRRVQIIADLRQESNVQFLDFGDEDEPDERIYKAQPFACGEAFSVSMMDSVTSSAFHSPGTLYLVEDLIQCSGTRTSCQIVGVPLDSEEHAGKTFQDLYNLQLERNNLVLGLYRQLPMQPVLTNSFVGQSFSSMAGVTQTKNYVNTAPNPDTLLEKTDIAFMLVNRDSTSPIELSS